MKKIIITLTLFICMNSYSQQDSKSNYWQQHVDYTMDIDVDVTNFQWVSIKDVAKIICNDVRVTDITVTTHDRQNEPRAFILNYWKPTISLVEGVSSLQLNYKYHNP